VEVVDKPDLSDAFTAAPALLGWLLVHDTPAGRTAGYVVETEAYDATDAASHSFSGETPRNSVMFGPAGRLYVYFTYGMHYCVNVVTGQAGDGQAVLLRALCPVEGLELMQRRRRRAETLELTNGPAKLAQALGIKLSHNGTELFVNGNLRLMPGIAPGKIGRAPRIGIRKAVDKKWRFFIVGNPYISRP
jgi:DNA-3-methyladenine glycosylase